MKKPQLVTSTSGIRGVVGNGLDPILVTAYAAAFGTLLRKGRVVLGRDARPSGELVASAARAGLMSVGRDVVDVGIVPTPTVEIAVKRLEAAGGICVTASHNPAPWNALKFFNDRGEFITAAQYKSLDKIFTSKRFAWQPHDRIGELSHRDDFVEEHLRMTLAQDVVRKQAIKRRGFTVVVDAINGAGSEALPELLRRLGVKVHQINCVGDGDFVHEPEPVPKNLQQLGRAVRRFKADLGMACDPDADRLALVDETGRPIGEELTLAIAVREVLRRKKGPTVINLSTSLVTADTARAAGSRVYLSKVGESNVVSMMRQKRAVIGGEGNGGVIYPSFHAGRDSLIGAALTLSCVATEKRSLAGLVETFPAYYTIKGKAPLPDDFSGKLKAFGRKAASLLGNYKANHLDGLRCDFEGGWVQLRSSNTEPIYRVIVETTDPNRSQKLYRDVTRYFK